MVDGSSVEEDTHDLSLKLKDFTSLLIAHWPLYWHFDFLPSARRSTVAKSQVVVRSSNHEKHEKSYKSIKTNRINNLGLK